ncbi:MAG: PilZ domain-containing protein [Phycisphaerae bacterium]
MVAILENKVNERVGKFINDFYLTSGTTNDYETRRNARRYQMTDTVDVMLDSTETPAEVILATGRDISTSGIGIYSPRPIPVGTEMVVNIDNGKDRMLAKAVSVHSTMSIGLFKIGARFIV